MLGVGGDNSPWGAGTFMEGVITKGFATNSTDEAVMANIVDAGYAKHVVRKTDDGLVRKEQSTVLSASELQAQLSAAIRSRAPAFTIRPGAYNFTTNNMNISGASRLRVVAAGVTIWFGGTAGLNISNSEGLHISGLSINYYNPPHGRLGVPGITYNLLNCTNVVSEDITIYKAPFFSVTAFNGGGGHVFRRFFMPNDTATDPETGRPDDPYPHQRDAFHFTDLRQGVTVEDSYASGFGDDCKIVMLSPICLLSISLIQEVSPFQTSTVTIRSRLCCDESRRRLCS